MNVDGFYEENSGLNRQSVDKKNAVLAAENFHDEEEIEKAWQALKDSGIISGPLPYAWQDDEAGSVTETGREDLAAPSMREDCAALEALEKEDSALEGKYQAVYEEIISRAPEHKVQPSLERVKKVLQFLGDPQNTYQVIHITGTNGKTSTTRAIDSLIRAKGLRTGRFTSPHLHTARERICLDGVAISRYDFLQTWEEVRPFIDMVDQESIAEGGPKLSFFEVFTVMGFVAFANAAVDVAVIEVGMGGRWDATNVVTPKVSVITSIALDHMRWLGADVSAIAREKVGIIKPRTTVVSAYQIPQVQEIIYQACEANHCEIIKVCGVNNDDISQWDDEWLAHCAKVVHHEPVVGGQLVDFATSNANYENVFVPIHGKFQLENMNVALCAVEAFFARGALESQVVAEGFALLSSPGRMEIVRFSPTIIIDAAHNPSGINALVEALESDFNFERVTVVFSAFADKDFETSLGILEPLAANLVVVEMNDERAAGLESLEEVANEVFGSERVSACENLEEAVVKAVDLVQVDENELTDTTAVIITGSVRLAAEARILFGKNSGNS